MPGSSRSRRTWWRGWSAGRAVFRAAVGAGDAVWERARGYALHQAALIIPYYAETNPPFVAMARRTIEQILAEVRSAGGA